MKKIIVDENDNQADWLYQLRKKIWKEVYIPEDLRKKFKIKYNAKKHLISFRKK